MNLHAIVSGAIGAVNPFITVTIQPSTGYTTSADGTRVPSYGTTVTTSAQKQPLQYNDIQQLDSLNIQGSRCKLYVNGSLNGIVRATGEGGSVVTLPDGSIWLVAVVTEDWGTPTGWTAALCTLQNGA